MSELPGEYSHRRPTRNDLTEILDLTQVADTSDFGGTDFNLGMLELDWSMPNFDPRTDAWLIEGPAGELVAYAHLNRRPRKAPEAMGWVHPQHRGKGIGSVLIELAEQRTREIVFAPGAEEPRAAVQLTNAATPGASELLESHGYRVNRTFWRMSIELGVVEPPEPAWPEGIQLRPMRVGTDDRTVYETIVAAFRDHWGSSPLPFEEWRDVRMGNRMFDASLWLLAWRGDRLVGATLNMDEDGEAWVQTLGVIREARGQGLGQALLIESFRAFHQRGHRKVYLGVDSENLTGATRLYENAGMSVDRRWLHWEKPLGPPETGTAPPEPAAGVA
jgi:mycothiol synthase